MIRVEATVSDADILLSCSIITWFSLVNALPLKATQNLLNTALKDSVLKVHIRAERQWQVKQKQGFWTYYVTAQQDNEMEEQQKRGQYYRIFY